MMILVTDGFFEWTDSRQEQFGMDRLEAVVRKHRDSSSRDIILRLHEAVLDFAGEGAQDDDLTAVIIKRR
jgi:serine phosphatase RsbU (regulator of sigma subunit)